MRGLAKTYPGDIGLVMAEFDRLRLVEQAATALVDVWDEDDGLCCNKHATPALRALAAAVRTETP